MYEFNRMPFGFTTAPITLQGAMENVLRVLKGEACVVYLDDVLVIGATWKGHLSNVDTGTSPLFKPGVRLNSEKCHIRLTSVSQLG